MLNPTEKGISEEGNLVLFSIEKNRLGHTGVEHRHKMHGPHFVLYPEG